MKRPHVGSVRHRCSQAHTSPPSQAVSLGSFWGQRRAEPTGRDRSGVVAGVRLTGPPASLPLHDLLRRSAPRGQILHPVCPSRTGPEGCTRGDGRLAVAPCAALAAWEAEAMAPMQACPTENREEDSDSQNQGQLFPRSPMVRLLVLVLAALGWGSCHSGLSLVSCVSS